MNINSLIGLLAFADLVLTIFIILVPLVALTVFIIVVVPVDVWFRCLISGIYVGIIRLIGMRFRGVDVKLVIDSFIYARKAGIDIEVETLERHYMAGGRVKNVVEALIAANSSQEIDLSQKQAMAIDLSGRDVARAVKETVKPKVIETPIISAVAKDGIELKVKARVTVRTNLERIIGGAGEETIKSRVGEGIVTTVGFADSYSDVLQNPEKISKRLIEGRQSLDNGTAYNIISVNIKDIDVGENIGARLKIKEAERDKQIAQAKAEERRARARAVEREMKARTEFMKAKLLDAETVVPSAISEAFKSGKIGVMDYYRMQNVISDTNMRNAIGGTDNPRLSTNKSSGSNSGDK